ncbi:anthranilate synthase component I [Halobacteriales archaeon QS_1_68_20]|nr:MAG: anthranilate synthase component I [Halobacteriales archaeon QS_1_68_20]
MSEPDVTRERFCELADGERPVVVRVAADLPKSTLLAAYAALTGRTTDRSGSPYAFLLESAEKTAGSDPDGAFRPSNEGPSSGGSSPASGDGAADDDAERHARYSFVGYDPEAVVTVDPDGIDVTSFGDAKYARLLEAGTPGGDGTAEPAGAATDDPDAFTRLQAATPDVRLANFPDGDRQLLQGGLVGFVAYEAVYDAWLSEVGVDRPDSPVPDAEFVLTTRTVRFDHVAGDASLVFTPVVTADEDPGAVYDDLQAEAERVASLLADAEDPDPGGFRVRAESAGPRDDYEAAVGRAKEAVKDGEVYQAVVSRERELRGDVDTLGLYAALREVNPSPYMYLLAHDDHSVVGASPETLVSVSGRRVVANPIAGTCPRGAGPVEDRRLAGEMLADAKERAEHTMLVDLARNDVRRVAEPGSVRVEEFMDVLKYSHVQHIESTVTGRLATDAQDAGRAVSGDAPDAFDATRATFPAGTLAGAPKIRAMELVDELEASPRGVYGGGVGYYDWTGDADVAIVIRSATVDHGDPDRVTVRAGAGVVADSDPAAEFEETESKLGGVLAAVERIEADAPTPEVSR